MAGGDTGDEPYKGKHGQQRWQKMRENVIKEWEAEQAEKSKIEKGAQPQHPARNTGVNGYEGGKKAEAEQGAHAERDGSRTVEEKEGLGSTTEGSVDANIGETISKAGESKMHKLKERLFKR